MNDFSGPNPIDDANSSIGRFPIAPPPPIIEDKFKKISLPIKQPTLELNDSSKISASSTTAYNHDIVEELNQVIAVAEKDIEQKFASLSLDIQFINSAMDFELVVKNYPEVSLRVLHNTAELFSSVLPPNALEFSHLMENLELFKEITLFGTLFLSSLSHGTDFIGIVCKNKMIKQSRSLLEELRADFQKKIDPTTLPSNDLAMTTETIEKTQLFFKEWDKKLKVQEKILSREKKELACSSTYTFLYTSLHIVELVAVKSAVVASVGLAGKAVVFVFNWIDFIKDLIKSAKFKSWQESYENWQKDNIDVIDKKVDLIDKKGKKFISEPSDFNPRFTDQENSDIAKMQSISDKLYNIEDIGGIEEIASDTDFINSSLHALDTIIETSENLLHKREATAKRKHIKINSKYQDYELKIKERNRSLYNFKLEELEKNLNSSLPLDELEKGFKHLIFFSEPEENEALREAFNQYKVSFSLGVNQEKENLIKKLNEVRLNPEHTNEMFEKWFSVQPKKYLIENYIDHQHAFEQTLKNSLKEVVQHKHALESKFFRMENISKGTITGMSLLSLYLSVALVVAGLLTAPMGFGLILLIVSIGPAGFMLGFLAINFLHKLYYKPETAKALTYPPRLAFRHLGKAFYAYRHSIKKKKLWTNADLLRELTTSVTQRDELKYKKALDDYNLAKADFIHSQTRIEEWTNKLTKLERDYAAKGWQDFAKHSSLMVAKDPKSFDSLRAFNEALIKCDFSLLSDETKTLLEEQIGINFEKLQTLIDEDLQTFSYLLQQYAAMTSHQLVDSIIQKQESLQDGA